MKALIIKLFKITLGLLGVAMVDSCIGKAEYGCPHSDFEAKGIVTDEEGKGIQGIRVVVSAEYPNPNYVGGPITDTLWTDHDGKYVSRDDNFAIMSSVKLEFEDVDGAENGGEFQNVTLEVPVFKVKDGDGNWYMGAYEAGADVTMLKK
jgi:putative lipoprotein (rSAM/lipoprotein system)